MFVSRSIQIGALSIFVLLTSGCAIGPPAKPSAEELAQTMEKGTVEQVRALLDRGADPNMNVTKLVEGHEHNVRPLFLAVERKEVSMIRLLVERGADIDDATSYGYWSPLCEAAHGVQQNLDLVQLLIELGANVNGTCSSDWKPLMLAARDGRLETVRFLVEHGAEVNYLASGAVYRSALDAAARAERGGTNYLEIVGFLLDHGADPNGPSPEGASPLHNAVRSGNPRVVQLLLERGADPSRADREGNTPLKIAKERGNTMLVRLLEQAEEAALASIQGAPGGAKAHAAPRLTQPAIFSDVDRLPAVKAVPKTSAYAIVVGIELYREQLAKAEFADRDAKLMSEYLTKVMGYPEEQVVVLLNEKATGNDLKKYFGDWLRNNVERDASVFIYYSGHGAPNPQTGEAFLVPYDGDPNFLDSTGYSLKRLYTELDKLPAKEITVVLDSCFSGAGGRSVIAKGQRPMVISVENPVLASGKVTVLAASSGAQTSSTYLDQGHGLLTYYFLKGLQGDGDLNKDGAIGLAELFEYVKPNVQRLARKQYNTDQVPQLLASSEVLHRGGRLVERMK